MKAAYTKAQGNREIRVSLNYIRYKQQAREKLRGEEGKVMRCR
ncbi:hypothetical protein FHS15_000204 [Paenibacillus castaneae]|nr:hypothetical protein [Paenibacillus castaneae]NIK75106.1 hypothetical protein [Paenibacillus castaneae]